MLWWAVFAAYTTAGSALSLSSRGRRQPSYRQILRNDGDVQYSGKVVVGGQEVDMILDTGSFEVVMFSSNCKSCGDPEKMFNPKKSDTFIQGKLHAEQSYGSGDTDSIESYDSISIGPYSTGRQEFWEVVDAEMPILNDATFQGIFGLGAPSSNPKLIQEDADTLSSEMAEMKQKGYDISKYIPVVENAEEVATFSKNLTLWLEAVQMTSFSICLGQDADSPGYVIYHDETDPSLFTMNVKVEGDTFWQAVLRNVEIHAPTADGKKETLSLGCDGPEGCIAFLDSGTSLLAAPQTAFDKIVASLEGFSSTSGGCSDLSHLPDLEFTFGGEKFSLPPESYVGEMTGGIPNWAVQHMPHLQLWNQQRIARANETDAQENLEGTWCVPLLMSLGSDPSWIFGLPFFRKYYSNFKLSADSADAESMHFAESDGNCELGTGSKLRVPRKRSHLRVDAQKLMPPRRFRQVGDVAPKVGRRHLVE